MPQCASLVTFRDRNAAQVFAIFKNHSYFRHPKHLSYRALLFFWVIDLALFAVIAQDAQATGLPESLRMLPRLTVVAIIRDARELRSCRLPAALHASDVGTDDRLTVHSIWRNDANFVASIMPSAFSET